MDWLAEATQHADADVSCKWLLTVGGGGLVSAIVFLVFWLKSVLKELKDEQSERLSDLKDQFRSMRHE